MKKQLAVLSLCAAFVTANISPSWAAFAVQGNPQSFRAAVQVGGPETASVNVELRKTANVQNQAQEFTWPNAQAKSGYRISDELARVVWDTTDQDGGVRVYTHNSVANPNANPQFVNPAQGTKQPSENPAGLIDTTNPTLTVPLAWRILQDPRTVSQTQTPGDTSDITPANPNNDGKLDVQGNQKPLDDEWFAWFFIIDREKPEIDFNGDGDTTDIGEAAHIYDQPIAYTNIAGVRGIHVRQGDTDFEVDSDKISYWYLATDFDQTGSGGDFATNTITFEAYIQ